ncbi:hypothetical protein ACLEPN_34265 [Myxococcus sp. 1LA]
MLLVFGLLVGCASPRSTRVPLDLGTGATRAPVGTSIDVEYQPRDAEAAQQVRLAVERALPRLHRWGTFDDTVTIVVHPNHASLERAANRPGHDFLRAWARYEQIELQSPRTWTARGASQGQVDELLLHELTHSLMYQWPRTGSAGRASASPSGSARAWPPTPPNRATASPAWTTWSSTGASTPTRTRCRKRTRSTRLKAASCMAPPTTPSPSWCAATARAPSARC